MAQKLKGNNMKKHLFITIALVVLSNLLVAQCKLYFDGQLIKAGTEEACQSEYKHRVAEYQVNLEFEYSYQKQENEIYDKMREINPDLMQGVSRPTNNSSISRSDITDKVNAYKKRFRLSCTEEQHHSRQTNNIVQPSPRTKRVATDMSKVGPRRNTSHNQGAELAEKYRRQREEAAERARIEWEKKVAEATKNAKESAERATAPAYQMIDNFSTGGDGDRAMRERAAADRASRQIGFGVSGEEKSYKIDFTDDEIKLIVKQYIYTKLKDNKYGFVEHIKLCFEKKAGFSLNELLVITAGNKKRNYEIIESYNKYIDKFTKQIINEACNELYYDWGVEFCEKNLLYDMALLSAAVYEDKDSPYPWGWEVVDHYGEDNHGYGDLGFYAALYKNVVSNVYCLAYRGTESNNISDIYNDIIVTDVGQALGDNFKTPKLKVPQHKQAVSLVNAIVKKYGDKGELYLTGHSLGGGLASIAGVSKPQCKTFTFNAAGVLMKTIDKYVPKESRSTKNIYAYSTVNDPLTSAQNFDYSAKLEIFEACVVLFVPRDKSLLNKATGAVAVAGGTYGVAIHEAVFNDNIKLIERKALDIAGVDHNYIPLNEATTEKKIEILENINYEILPKALGQRQVIINSSGMGHSIVPIVELYDKNKNGSCISCQRKIIEQQRKYLERFDSESIKKRYKIQLN